MYNTLIGFYLGKRFREALVRFSLGEYQKYPLPTSDLYKVLNLFETPLGLREPFGTDDYQPFAL